jgi:hypothetical protein
MKHRYQVITLVLASALIAACGAKQSGEPLTAEPTQETSTPVATATTQPVTAEPTEAAATPTAAETVDQVQIFLIALEDNGVSGDKIGCDDSVVGVTRQITPSASPLEAALNELLSIKDEFYGESGLYNALDRSDLEVASAVVENGQAIVRLRGQMLLGGVCDDPRAQAQIEYTALHSPGVQGVEIFINGEPIQEVLSERG